MDEANLIEDRENICDCSCHGLDAWHCLPCCQGECNICGKNIINFDEHVKICEGSIHPMIRMMRKFEEAEKNGNL